MPDEQPDTLAAGVALKEVYEDYFPMGAAVDSGSYRSHADLVTQHFASITAENEMKFESLQRIEGTFNYTAADSIVDFAVENGLLVRGHALVWHRQNPSWLFSDGAGGVASPELLLERMRAHISNVVGHFKGRVYAWDVVNEAMMDDGSYRDGEEMSEDQRSHWYASLGKRYIAEAFRAAHEADPDAKLYYNDYHNYLPAKREGIMAMLEELIADGVPVHGVGLQGHFSIEPAQNPEHHSYYQTVEHVEDAIEDYASLGLDVQLTELDLSVYVGGVQYDQSSFYTEDTFTDEVEQQQAERYAEFFELFREHRDEITGVTFWGVADDNTWLSELSSGRQDFPLLFDAGHRPKRAFFAVTEF